MKQSLSFDSYFKISQQDDGIYLSIYPPIGNGKLPDINEIIHELESLHIKEYDREKIEKVLQECPNVPVKISEIRKDISDFLHIEVSDDKMSAYLTIVGAAQLGRLIKLQDILDELRKANVVFGIDEERIEQMLINGEYNVPVKVASGKEPTDGLHATLKYTFDKERRISFDEEALRVDFKELNLINLVEAGDVIVEKVPATKGIAGRCVDGELILPKEGKDIPLPRGKNTYVKDDHLLVAAIAGHVVYKGNNVNVEPVLQVKNVDYSIGNIDFPGSVIIRGDVLEGFKVRASGDIEVQGCVEPALVEAGGNIIVRQGIVGKGKGKVVSGGSIVARFIEYAKVQAKRNIIVEEGILHSYISARGSVVVRGSRGKIIGGKTVAGCDVVARQVGSWVEVHTEIRAGVNPTICEQIDYLSEHLKSIKQEYERIECEIRTLKTRPDKTELLKRYEDRKQKLAKEIDLTTERLEYLEKILPTTPLGRVCVWGIVYPQTKISINNATMCITHEYEHVTFVNRARKIKVRPYEEIKVKL